MSSFIFLLKYSSHYDKVDFKKRHFLIRPLSQAGITYEDARNRGFKKTQQLWTTWLSEKSRNSGRQCYNNNEKVILFDYFIQIYKFTTKVVEKKFLERKLISKSSFDNCLNSEKHINKMARKTDVCDFCDWLKIKSKSIT